MFDGDKSHGSLSMTFPFLYNVVFIETIRMKAIRSNWFPVVLFAVVAGVIAHEVMQWEPHKTPMTASLADGDSTWQAPSLFLDQTTGGKEREMVIYGEDLVAHTANYLGPHGSVVSLSNGMNCQNCHLDAGTRSWGNNYGAVASTYPKYRERSGAVETIEQRVNDCFERSLNGQALHTNSYELQSIVSYIKWLGKEVPKRTTPRGAGIEKLAYPDRAADPVKGKAVFVNFCQGCHGPDGQGQMAAGGKSYATPPLWGAHSYNDGAGLYRLSNFAGFVKNNMPFNQSSHNHPKLTNEEAWDVAAFVNSQSRPHKDQRGDWPDITKKPVDFPFGPFADNFKEKQHKYGPYKPIAEARKT